MNQIRLEVDWAITPDGPIIFEDMDATVPSASRHLPEMRDLVSRLRVNGHVADMQEHTLSARGLTWLEEVGIFVGSGAATALINLTLNDFYNIAKQWAREKVRQRESAPTSQRWPESIRIYDIRGNLVAYWKIDENGEKEYCTLPRDEAIDGTPHAEQ
jgi:hypothetical protein